MKMFGGLLNSPLANACFGANALGQQAGIWFGLSALTQIAFGDFRYPPTVICNCPIGGGGVNE